MSLPPVIEAQATTLVAPGQLPPSLQPPPGSQPHRPPRREGAFHFKNLTPAEQALEDAMNWVSSPPPESVLGKWTHGENEGDHGSSNTELDQDASTTQPQPPTISNLTAATLRYASKKKLGPEQHGDLEAFLLVSFVITWYALINHNIWTWTRTQHLAGRLSCLHASLC